MRVDKKERYSVNPDYIQVITEESEDMNQSLTRNLPN